MEVFIDSLIMPRGDIIRLMKDTNVGPLLPGLPPPTPDIRVDGVRGEVAEVVDVFPVGEVNEVIAAIAVVITTELGGSGEDWK